MNIICLFRTWLYLALIVAIVQNKLKQKIWKLIYHWNQHHISVNARWKKQCRVNKKKLDWKEGYITIPKESGLKKN